jgi:type IV pilus assembly protein PilP
MIPSQEARSARLFVKALVNSGVALAVVASFGLLMAYAQNPPAPPVPASDVPAAAANTALSEMDVGLFLEPYNYDRTGRRDPFLPGFSAVGGGGTDVQIARPLLPLERFELDQIKLIGIIWDVKDPKGMFRDPTGKVHVLGKDQRIGRNQGYIAVIRDGEVVVVESVLKDGEVTYTTRSMPLVAGADKK